MRTKKHHSISIHRLPSLSLLRSPSCSSEIHEYPISIPLEISQIHIPRILAPVKRLPRRRDISTAVKTTILRDPCTCSTLEPFMFESARRKRGWLEKEGARVPGERRRRASWRDQITGDIKHNSRVYRAAAARNPAFDAPARDGAATTGARSFTRRARSPSASSCAPLLAENKRESRPFENTPRYREMDR